MFPTLYHAHHNRHLEDIPFWLGLAKQSGDPVLELGCGTGRVLVPVSLAGYRVMGIDFDLSLLQLCKANIDLRAEPMPLLIASDMCDFNLAIKFPLIILPCNTFSTLDEIHRLACLDCVHKHLKKGGIFAVSIPNPVLLRNLPARSNTELEDEFFHPQTGNPVQVSSSWRRLKNKFIVTWSYDHLYPDGAVQHMVAETRHHLTSFHTYEREFTTAGLVVKGVHGDFDYSDYKEESPHLIILAAKRSY